MGNVQQNYNASPDIGYEGQIADMRDAGIITRLCEPATIGFGRAVIRGAGAKQVKLGADGIFEGITVRDITLPALNSDLYKAGDNVAVMDRGAIFAVAAAAVAAGDPVYRKADGTLTNAIGARTATSAAKAGGNAANTGTMGAVTVSGDIPNGVYNLRITAAASNAGTFVITDKNGAVIGPAGTVAVAYSFGGLAFTLADGATDFIVGEGFDITVVGGAVRIPNAVWDRAASQDALSVIVLR